MVVPVRDIQAAFAAGRARPPGAGDAASTWEFLVRLEATVRSHLSAEDQAYFWACFYQQEDALAAARQGRLHEAQQAFLAIHDRLRRSVASADADALVQVFLAASEAYLHHRLGEDATACDLLLRASALDHELATVSGLDVMSAHRLQLAHNLLRVYVRQGYQEPAAEQASALIDYLELDAASVPSDIASPRRLLNSVSDAVVGNYFNKLCSEVALVFAGRSDVVTRNLFESFQPHVSCRENRFDDQGHVWIASKYFMLHGELKSFWLTVLSILHAGRRSHANLWFATISDIIAVCASEDAIDVADWLRNECSLLSDAPGLLFARPNLAAGWRNGEHITRGSRLMGRAGG